jgi:hypothetical protein
MKRALFIFITMLVVIPIINAQKITTDALPVLIYRSFKSKFPASNQESWAKVNDSVYQVDFYNEKKRLDASFDTSGIWLNTETEINFSQVPKVVTAAFNKQFPGFMVQETLQIESADRGTSYSFIINKGSEGYEVEISAKGELLKKDAAKADE